MENGYSTLSLGYIGLYECTVAMKGCSHTTPEGEEFAMRVMKHLNAACKKWRAESGLGFSLYGTPAESLCYRFARIDKERFGTIKDITDKGYYTNSYHVDVREHIDAFSKFKFENQFQPISTGGCISYVEIPNMKKNPTAVEDLVRFIYDNIQYAEFNTKSDYCQVCGFDGEIKVNDNLEWECPQCHNKDQSKMNVVRRTVAIWAKTSGTSGKRKEIKSRVLHSVRGPHRELCRYQKTDVANGPGVRVSLFVSGCTHHCKGCFNEEAWDFLMASLLTNMPSRKSWKPWNLTISGASPFWVGSL